MFERVTGCIATEHEIKVAHFSVALVTSEELIQVQVHNILITAAMLALFMLAFLFLLLLAQKADV